MIRERRLCCPVPVCSGELLPVYPPKCECGWSGTTAKDCGHTNLRRNRQFTVYPTPVRFR